MNKYEKVIGIREKNKYEEAIETIKFSWDKKELKQANELINTLIEKETPKKYATEHYLFNCPVCNTILKREQKYCDNCGQRIEWGE